MALQRMPHRAAVTRSRLVGRLLALSALVMLGGFALPACGTREILYVYTGEDAGADAGTCTCVKWDARFDDPMWLRTTPGGPASFNPDDVGSDCPTLPEGYNGAAGLTVISECPPCTCETPKGECVLPSTLTAHDVICQDLGQPHKDISFDAPPGWKGGCDDTNPVSAAANAKSLSIAPLTINESCAVGPPVPAREIDYYWKEIALGCHGRGWSECGDPRSRCVPDGDAPSPDFKLCIKRDGDFSAEPCPDDWPDQHVFYWPVPQNLPTCTACACSPPVGSMCQSKAYVYEDTDTTCGGPIVEGDIGISSNGPKCFDIMPPGLPLGSKYASSPIYTPGMCAPMGGDVIGGPPTTIDPMTWCCKH